MRFKFEDQILLKLLVPDGIVFNAFRAPAGKKRGGAFIQGSTACCRP